jgi:EmrB/QacA subfamily drug resistance transporter
MISAAELEARWSDDAAMRRSAWLGVCVGAAAIFLFVVDAGLVALALPKIEAEFPDVSRSTLAWLASGLLVAQASMLLVGGRLGDRRGRKKYYLGGLLVFSIGSGLTAVAPTVPLMLVARVVQGVGAGFLTSSALALVLPMFPKHMAAKVVGVWGAIGSVAAWLTPTAGSYLVDLSWRWAFAAVAPLGVAIYLLGRRVLVEQLADDLSGRTDRASYYLGPMALGLMIVVLAQGPRWGWTSPGLLLVALVAAGLFVTFVHRCRTVTTPLVDLAMFKIPHFVAGIVAGAFQQLGFFGWFVTAPLIMNGLWGWSVRASGFALALGQVMASVGSPLGGALVARFGHTKPIVVGAAITATGVFWMGATAATSANFWGGYLPGALLFGLGGGMAGTLATGAAMTALPDTMLGSGNSVIQLVRRMGGALGVALAVALLGEGSGAALLGGARRVWFAVAAFHLLMIPPFLVLGVPRTGIRRK